MGSWRTFIGLDVDEPDIVVTDDTHPTWLAARDALTSAVHARGDDPDDCPVCWDNSRTILQELAEATAEQPYTGFIDGYDYALRQV